MKDQLSDMLTRIRNGQRSGLLKVKLYKPTSNTCIQVLNILYKEGYIRGFKINNIKPLEVTVYLKYTYFGTPVIKEIKRISKPGRKFYTSIKPL